MTLRLESLAALLESSDQEEYFSNLTSFTREIGFDRFSIEAQTITSEGCSADQIVSSYPAEWLKRYQDQQYSSIDPIVSHAMNSSLPLIWGDYLFDTQPRQQFREEAIQFGIRHGVSIPVRTRFSTGVLNLASDMPEKKSLKLIKNSMAEVSLLAMYAYEALTKLGISQELAVRKQLISPRERECLKWCSAGKTAWETSRILNISERTVNFHLGNSAAKLGTRGTRHTVSRAILLGLI